MNIIYKLTNLDKPEGRRFYIGSKTECFIDTVDGIDVIVSNKTGLPYYGSSTCSTMKQDMQEGHRFVAEILEEVPDKRYMFAVEDTWIRKLDAVNSSDYYNIGYPLSKGREPVDQHAPYNKYGESILEYGKCTSNMNKKYNSAKKFGFNNVGEFSLFIYNHLLNGMTSAQIAKDLGWENRHGPLVYIRKYNMDKCKQEVAALCPVLQKEIRLLFAEGVSIKRISQIKSLEIPTVCIYMGDYGEIYKKSFLVAQRRGLTKEELEIEVTKRILDGEGFLEVARDMKINEISVKRYFLRCVRQRLKSSDL